MTHVIAAAGGFFAGLLFAVGILTVLRRRRWRRRYVANRFEEIL